jgi:hypothetical protein
MTRNGLAPSIGGANECWSWAQAQGSWGYCSRSAVLPLPSLPTLRLVVLCRPKADASLRAAFVLYCAAGAVVQLTDLPSLLPLMQENIALNAASLTQPTAAAVALGPAPVRCTAHVLQWGVPSAAAHSQNKAEV